MAVTTAAVVGGVAAAGSAYNGYRGAKAQEDAARAAQQAAGRTANLGTIMGAMSGGPRVSGGPGNLNIDFGALNGLNMGLGNLASNLVGQGQVQGLPLGVQQAAITSGMALQSPLDTRMLQGQELLSGNLRSAFEQAQAGLGTASQPFNPQLQNTAFQGAAQQAAAASQGFDQVYGTTLSNLRAQAQPFEERQLAGLNNNLFATGRLGTTGGALQTEAFARGLGQADLSRQLEATNQARLTQQNALGLAQGLSGIGNANAAMGDSLLQNAFGRFSGLAGQLDQNLQQRFGNSVLLNQIGSQNAQQNLTNQIQLAGLPAGLQSAQLGNVLQALQGQQALQGMGLNLANFGLASAQAQGNLSLGQASNAIAAASNPNIGAQNDFLGSLFGGIAGRVGGQGGAGLLGGLFGQGMRVPGATDWIGAATQAGVS